MNRTYSEEKNALNKTVHMLNIYNHEGVFSACRQSSHRQSMLYISIGSGM